MGDAQYFAHESSYVDQGAHVGRGTKIWHFCHISSGAVIGERCSFGQNVFIAGDVRVGDNVKVQNNVSLYAGVELEDNVFCGPSCVFTNVKTPRCSYPRNTAGDYLRTLVRHDASIGANATIVCGITLGEYAFIAAGAVVTKDVPAYGLIAGVPGGLVGWACECGVRLTFGAGAATCGECGKQYEQMTETSIRRIEESLEDLQ